MLSFHFISLLGFVVANLQTADTLIVRRCPIIFQWQASSSCFSKFLSYLTKTQLRAVIYDEYRPSPLSTKSMEASHFSRVMSSVSPPYASHARRRSMLYVQSSSILLLKLFPVIMCYFPSIMCFEQVFVNPLLLLINFEHLKKIEKYFLGILFVKSNTNSLTKQ